MMKKIGSLIFIIILLCLKLSQVEKTYILESIQNNIWFILILTLGYLVLYKLVFQFIGIVIHELTHFIIAILFVRKVGKIKLSRYEGAVDIEKTNSIIDLSPYFIPLITIIVIILFQCSDIHKYELQVILTSYYSTLFELYISFL